MNRILAKLFIRDFTANQVEGLVSNDFRDDYLQSNIIKDISIIVRILLNRCTMDSLRNQQSQVSRSLKSRQLSMESTKLGSCRYDMNFRLCEIATIKTISYSACMHRFRGHHIQKDLRNDSCRRGFVKMRCCIATLRLFAVQVNAFRRTVASDLALLCLCLVAD